MPTTMISQQGGGSQGGCSGEERRVERRCDNGESLMQQSGSRVTTVAT